MTFPEKLITLRAGRGWSQERLAKELGVTRQAVGRWERGECLPDAVGLTGLARVFDIDSEWLLDDSAAGTPEPRAARRVKLAWFDWLMLSLAAASLIAMLCGLNMDRMILTRNINYRYPWWSWIVLFFRYAVWFAAGWVIAALAACAFRPLRGRRRMIPLVFGVLTLIGMALCVIPVWSWLINTVNGTSPEWYGTLILFSEKPAMCLIPGFLLGYAAKRQGPSEQQHR